MLSAICRQDFVDRDFSEITFAGGWDELKRVQRWLRGHPSSKTRPVKEDTVVELNHKHPLWRALLPLFDKYYWTDKVISDAEICADLAEAKTLLKHSPASRSEVFRRIEVVPIVRRPKDIRRAFKRKFADLF